MTNMTYVMAIDNAIALFSQGGQIDAEDMATVEKLEALKAQLVKRATSGRKTPTKTQKENEILIERIYEALAECEEGVTVTELIAGNDALTGMSCQKASALLKKLVDAERVTKEKAGKKILYHVA